MAGIFSQSVDSSMHTNDATEIERLFSYTSNETITEGILFLTIRQYILAGKPIPPRFEPVSPERWGEIVQLAQRRAKADEENALIDGNTTRAAFQALQQLELDRMLSVIETQDAVRGWQGVPGYLS